MSKVIEMVLNNTHTNTWNVIILVKIHLSLKFGKLLFWEKYSVYKEEFIPCIQKWDINSDKSDMLEHSDDISEVIC